MTYEPRVPLADRLGYARLQPGETIPIQHDEIGMTIAKLRTRIYNYGAYHGIKFSTHNGASALYVKRLPE